jgi:hypothetical protein
MRRLVRAGRSGRGHPLILRRLQLQGAVDLSEVGVAVAVASVAMAVELAAPELAVVVAAVVVVVAAVVVVVVTTPSAWPHPCR